MSETKKSRTPQIIFTVLLVALVAYFFISNNSNFDAKKYIEEKYNTMYENTEKDLITIAQLNSKTRGVAIDDTSTVIFKGERIATKEMERLENLRRGVLLNGLQCFRKSDWLCSIEKFNKYVEQYDDPQDDSAMALFYLAKSKLNNGNYGHALQSYNEFIHAKHADQKMNHTAEWDRVICYMMVDEDKVKPTLELMSEDNSHSFQDEAKGLKAYF